MSPSPPFNKLFAEKLESLEKLLYRQGDAMRAMAYRKAKQAITNYSEQINSVQDIKDLKGIGKTTIDKLEQLVQTGEIDLLEEKEMITIGDLYKDLWCRAKTQQKIS